MIVNQLNNCQ